MIYSFIKHVFAKDMTADMIDSYCNSVNCRPEQRLALMNNIIFPSTFLEVNFEQRDLDAARMALKIKEDNNFDKTLAIKELAQRGAQLLYANSNTKTDYYSEKYDTALDVNWNISGDWEIASNVMNRRFVLKLKEQPSGYKEEVRNIVLNRRISCDGGIAKFDILLEEGNGGFKLLVDKIIYSILIDSTNSIVRVGSSVYGTGANEIEVIGEKTYIKTPTWQTVVVEWRDKKLSVSINKTKLLSVPAPHLYGTGEVGFFGVKNAISFDNIVFTSAPELLNEKTILTSNKGNGSPILKIEATGGRKESEDSENNVPGVSESEDAEMNALTGTPLRDSVLNESPKDKTLSGLPHKNAFKLADSVSSYTHGGERVCQGIDVMNVSHNIFANCEKGGLGNRDVYLLDKDTSGSAVCLVNDFFCNTFSVKQTIELDQRAGLLITSSQRTIIVEAREATQDVSISYRDPASQIHTNVIHLQTPVQGRIDVAIKALDIENGVKTFIISINNEPIHTLKLEISDGGENYRAGLFTLIGANGFTRLDVS